MSSELFESMQSSGGRHHSRRTILCIVLAFILVGAVAAYAAYQLTATVPVAVVNYVKIVHADLIGGAGGECTIAGDGLSVNCVLTQPFSKGDTRTLNVTLHNSWTAQASYSYTAESSNPANVTITPASGGPTVIPTDSDKVMDPFTITAVQEGTADITVTITWTIP